MSSNISTSDFALMEASDDDGDYTGLKISHNRKNKKAGGWQQLGMVF
jgi:hypothetical protein